MTGLSGVRHQVEIWGHSIGRAGHVIRYGYFGQPVIAFPTELGRAWEWETKGMLGALGPLIEAGRIKLYCVDAFDTEGWSDRSLPLEEQARREAAYQEWIIGPVTSWIGADSPGVTNAIVTGASLGAYRALTIALRRPDLYPTVIGLSGNYDPTQWGTWGEAGTTAYSINPTWTVPDLGGDHLDWIRRHLGGVLVVGQGDWETYPTQALPSTRHMGGLLADKGLRIGVDEWGTDVSHDWWWWDRQAAFHLDLVTRG